MKKKSVACLHSILNVTMVYGILNITYQNLVDCAKLPSAIFLDSTTPGADPQAPSEKRCRRWTCPWRTWSNPKVGCFHRVLGFWGGLLRIRKTWLSNQQLCFWRMKPRMKPIFDFSRFCSLFVSGGYSHSSSTSQWWSQFAWASSKATRTVELPSSCSCFISRLSCWFFATRQAATASVQCVLRRCGQWMKSLCWSHTMQYPKKIGIGPSPICGWKLFMCFVGWFGMIRSTVDDLWSASGGMRSLHQKWEGEWMNKNWWKLSNLMLNHAQPMNISTSIQAPVKSQISSPGS